jgi:hypothetical protein
LHRFCEMTADLTERFGGPVVQHTGYGHLATFDRPTQASAAPRRCARMSRQWASRSAPASIPASANCLTATSGGSRYTSPHVSAAKPAPATSSSHARCETWSSPPALAMRTAAVSSCAACPASGNFWRSIATAHGLDQRRRNRSQPHPRPSDRDAPAGPCRGVDGQAGTVDPLRCARSPRPPMVAAEQESGPERTSVRADSQDRDYIATK